MDLNHRMNSESLAQVLKTNPTFVRKLVSRLVEAEIVSSYRGKGGGIKIARSPKDITLKDIYLAASQEKTLVSAHKKPALKACPVSCSIEVIFCEIVQGIESSTQDYLAKKTLSDLLIMISAAQ